MKFICNSFEIAFSISTFISAILAFVVLPLLLLLRPLAVPAGGTLN